MHVPGKLKRDSLLLRMLRQDVLRGLLPLLPPLLPLPGQVD
jgi:hypothetical protein